MFITGVSEAVTLRVLSDFSFCQLAVAAATLFLFTGFGFCVFGSLGVGLVVGLGVDLGVVDLVISFFSTAVLGFDSFGALVDADSFGTERVFGRNPKTTILTGV